MLTPAEIVDLEHYPIADLGTGPGEKFAMQCRKQFVDSGLCMLPGFVRESALQSMGQESGRYLEHAYFCDSSHNAYLTEADEGADELDRRQEKTFVGSVPYDQIPENSVLNTLYGWDPLKDFIGFVLGKSEFFRFADPFGACSVNVFVDGGRHGWHFDESEYTVTLMLQAPEQGGEFEYVPRIRGLDNEREIVRRTLDGNRDAVVTLPFTPGTLLIFGGRQTLHRVTEVTGSRPRLVPVLCYAETPGQENSESVRKLFWGRANPGDSIDRIHHAGN